MLKPDNQTTQRQRERAREAACAAVLRNCFNSSPIALGRALGISRQYVSGWKVIPLQHVRDLADITGLPCEEIHPYPYPERTNEKAKKPKGGRKASEG